MSPNGPRLTAQQLAHAINVYERRVKAKKLEIDSYAKFRDHARGQIGALLGERECEAGIETGAILLSPSQRSLCDAVENLCAAKVEQGILDLEELELQVKALKQAQSGLVIPR